MKKKTLGMLVLTLTFGVIAMGCASLTWNTPVTETGTRGGMETALQNAGAREIARYTRVLGIFRFGGATFDGLVIAAARAGDSVHYLNTHGLFFRSVRAFATSP
ncbi:MAG: hypothetical protein FWC64_06750 [Treponema sp.]|nr:hypothetical protein [Treponema sp.]